MDAISEQPYDDATLIASKICNVPISLLTLADREREWLKSKIGMAHTELPRAGSFSTEAIRCPGVVSIVDDATRDHRFDSNALVKGPSRVRFYAGPPLITREGFVLGTISVMESAVRALLDGQIKVFQAIARQVLAQFEMRLVINDSHHHGEVLRRQQSTLVAASTRQHRESETDGLTRFFNRAAFDKYFLDSTGEAVARAEPLSLIMINLDHFRTYKAEFGHSLGVDVLRQVGAIIKRAARRNDIAARYGG